MTLEKAVVRRFAKGFLAGGLASAGGLLMVGATINSLSDLKSLLISLCTAFFAGGLLAIEKMLSWQDEPEA